jgi:hypothetical protein
MVGICRGNEIWLVVVNNMVGICRDMVGICRGNDIWLVYVEVMTYGWYM